MKPNFVLRVAWLAVCAALPSSRVFAGFAGTETYLAAIGNPQGAGGAQFLSDVWVTDVSASPVTFTFQFLRAGQANLSPASFSDTLSPGQTKRYSDVVGAQLHLTNVNGAARILSNGEIFVSERIYNRPAGVPLSQTAGQFFSGIPKGFSIGLGQSATLQGVYLGAGLDFRYNYVLLETSGSACTVHVQALDGAGSQLGAADFPLLAYEHLLLSAGALAPAASTSNARLVATVMAGSGTALFAGSQVGNGAPQDQSGFETELSRRASRQRRRHEPERAHGGRDADRRHERVARGLRQQHRHQRFGRAAERDGALDSHERDNERHSRRVPDRGSLSRPPPPASGARRRREARRWRGASSGAGRPSTTSARSDRPSASSRERRECTDSKAEGPEASSCSRPESGETARTASACMEAPRMRALQETTSTPASMAPA